MPVIYLIVSCFRRFRPVVTALLLAYVFSLLLQLFSYIYWSYGTTRNFSASLSHLDSLYFALGTLTTAGTGNISATSETARGVQALQMGLDLAFIGFVVALVLARYSDLLTRPQAGSLPDMRATAVPTPTTDAGQLQQASQSSGAGRPPTQPRNDPTIHDGDPGERHTPEVTQPAETDDDGPTPGDGGGKLSPGQDDGEAP